MKDISHTTLVSAFLSICLIILLISSLLPYQVVAGPLMDQTTSDIPAISQNQKVESSSLNSDTRSSLSILAPPTPSSSETANNISLADKISDKGEFTDSILVSSSKR